MKQPLEYYIWNSMKQRCENPRNKSYKNYGGRGISVCEEWRDYKAFAADMGEKPEGGMLDRIDNDGNYEPSNCRWATRTESNNNTRRNRLVTYEGENLTVSELVRIVGPDKLKARTVYKRLDRGWSVKRAVLTPPRALTAKADKDFSGFPVGGKWLNADG